MRITSRLKFINKLQESVNINISMKCKFLTGSFQQQNNISRCTDFALLFLVQGGTICQKIKT